MSNVDSLVEAFLAIGHALEADFDRVAASLSLTTQGAAALMMLGRRDAIKMQELAQMLACDAGNLSGSIDRLEEAALVERVVSATDRRVRLLRLTARGRKMADKVIAASARCAIPARLAAMTAAERERLGALLAKVSSADGRVTAAR
jgi:DNA-binding MarR family transcriptional regulator